jgi:Xaa-Pro aminopeptidase
MNDTETRLSALRAEMKRRDLDALLIPRADEYLGEYLPPHNERLLWATGFTGSAGLAIVLRDSAAIFVDGRYTVQVRQQVCAEHFQILHLVDDPQLPWLVDALAQGSRVAYDPRLHSLGWQRDAEKQLAKAGLELVELDQNLVDACWQDRPLAHVQQAILLDERYTGRSSLEKRRDIAARVSEQGADAALVFAADSVAWLLNIRGRDIPSLPLVLGFALLDAEGSLTFFTDPAKIPPGFEQHVGPAVTVEPEQAAAAAFARLEGKKVLADPDNANAWTQLVLQRAGAELIDGADPVALPKACKNDVEVGGMQAAHLRDAIAETRFLAWLDREVAAGRLHDEALLSDTLLEFRQQQELFQEVSFDTISAAGGNAAMCHYNHLNNGQPAQLAMDSVYLVDSGGQYLDGTTDITRTVAIGDPGDEARRMFSLVLKGHIALDQARFPEGTTGSQLDVLARQYLWQQGFDYDHGTGHGVGCFLSVHEGPQRIGKLVSNAALMPGMVVSNEPGYYKADCYGMRCENLLVVRELARLQDTDKALLGFEALTFVPFDRRMLDLSLLDADELGWLNDYHARVEEKIAPHLQGDDLAWLKAAVAPV